VKFGVRDPDIFLLSICEFRENRRKGGRSLHANVETRRYLNYEILLEGRNEFIFLPPLINFLF